MTSIFLTSVCWLILSYFLCDCSCLLYRNCRSPSPEFLESPARPWDEPLICKKDIEIKNPRFVDLHHTIVVCVFSNHSHCPRPRSDHQSIIVVRSQTRLQRLCGWFPGRTNRFWIFPLGLSGSPEFGNWGKKCYESEGNENTPVQLTVLSMAVIICEVCVWKILLPLQTFSQEDY